jgi:fumarylpyruvate hydrolase
MRDASTHIDFVLPPPPYASVAVHDSTARFPVRRIICVGRNYAAHRARWGAIPIASRRSFS